VFWVILVYFNIRSTLPKFDTFLLGHPVYVYICIPRGTPCISEFEFIYCVKIPTDLKVVFRCIVRSDGCDVCGQAACSSEGGIFKLGI
jgi:hypothetical protein